MRDETSAAVAGLESEALNGRVPSTDCLLIRTYDDNAIKVEP